MVDVEKCRKCGAKYPQGGDGYDGMCPSCADRAEKVKGCAMTESEAIKAIRDLYLQTDPGVDGRTLSAADFLSEVAEILERAS